MWNIVNIHGSSKKLGDGENMHIENKNNRCDPE